MKNILSLEACRMDFEKKSIESFMQAMQANAEFALLRNSNNFNEFVKFYIKKEQYFKKVFQLLQQLVKRNTFLEDISNKDFKLWMHKLIISFVFHSGHFLWYWKKLKKDCQDAEVLANAEYFAAWHFGTVENDIVKMTYHYHNILFTLEKKRSFSNENKAMLIKVYGALSGVYENFSMLERALEFSNKALSLHNSFRTTDPLIYLHQLIYNISLKLELKLMGEAEAKAYADMIYLYIEHELVYASSFLLNNLIFKLFNLFIGLLIELKMLEVLKEVLLKYDSFLEQFRKESNNDYVLQAVLDGYRLQKLQYLALCGKDEDFLAFLKEHEESILKKIDFSKYSEGRMLFAAAIAAFRKKDDSQKEKIFLEKAVDFERKHMQSSRQLQVDMAKIYADGVRREQRVKLEKEKNEMLKSHNKELQELAFLIAHEMKSPFDTLAMLIDLLKDEQLSVEEKEQIMLSLERLTEQSGAMIEDLYLYSKRQKIDLEAKAYPLQEVIELIQANLARLIENHSAELIVVGASTELRTNKALVLILLQNFMVNAIQNYKGNDCPRLQITCKRNKTQLSFEISDNGPGLSDQLKAYLMDNRNRDILQNRQGVGGLGLYICKKIVFNLGGKISVDSITEQGTRILLQFPIKAKP